MIDWKEKSDDEINNAVKLVLISKHEKETDFDKFFLELLKSSELDYCNNPAFSWPIIIDNEISIIPPVSNGTNGWKAERFYSDNCGRLIDRIDKNPLRAAMIVFLMMNEQ